MPGIQRCKACVSAFEEEEASEETEMPDVEVPNESRPFNFDGPGGSRVWGFSLRGAPGSVQARHRWRSTLLSTYVGL